jgi:SanA protein
MIRDRKLLDRRHLLGGVTILGLAAVAVAPRIGFAVVARPLRHSAAEVPPRAVAIVFGARVYQGGQPSAMLIDRVKTGADLYRAGKAQVLLMTGDSSRADYDEPGAMRRQALSLGVPDNAIVLDYAGTRTYDSCFRAKHIFGVNQAILVTQGFHLDRALVLCTELGVDSVGVSADYQRPEGYRLASITYSRLREVPAAVSALWDLIRRPSTPARSPLPRRRVDQRIAPPCYLQTVFSGEGFDFLEQGAVSVRLHRPLVFPDDDCHVAGAVRIAIVVDRDYSRLALQSR